MNITEIESAYSRGQVEFDKWYAKFEETWNRPVIAGQLGTLLASIPSEVKQHLPQSALNALQDKIIGVRHGPQIQQQEIQREFLRPAAQRYHGQVPGERPINE